MFALVFSCIMKTLTVLHEMVPSQDVNPKLCVVMAIWDQRPHFGLIKRSNEQMNIPADHEHE